MWKGSRSKFFYKQPGKHLNRDIIKNALTTDYQGKRNRRYKVFPVDVIQTKQTERALYKLYS